MQFANQANNQDIVTLARRFSGADADELPINELTAYANIIGARVWSWIFESYGGMKYDDVNQSGDPTSTDSLVSGTAQYSLPTSALSLTGVEVKDQAGFWYQLKPITEEQIREKSALGDFLTTDGYPQYYHWVGGNVNLYPAPNYASADGLKYFLLRGDVEFEPDDETKSPGFATVFHEVIPTGIAEIYTGIEGKERHKKLANDMTVFERNIRSYYGKLHKAHGRPNVRIAGGSHTTGPGLMETYE